jgi:hypothetical protein
MAKVSWSSLEDFTRDYKQWLEFQHPRLSQKIVAKDELLSYAFKYFPNMDIADKRKFTDEIVYGGFHRPWHFVFFFQVLNCEPALLDNLRELYFYDLSDTSCAFPIGRQVIAL